MNIENQSDIVILEDLCQSKRGGHSLSLIDLLEVQTLDLELSAWLISHVSQGASYIIGAGPGGVGKTTTMRALLSVVPDDRPFGIALPGQITGTFHSPHCIISHELSNHRPPGYLWGNDLREFFNLSELEHMLVGNMHVDDIDQAYDQICQQNGVPESQFCSINLFVFLRVEGEDSSSRRINNPTAKRLITKIFYSDGSSPHQLVYSEDKGLLANAYQAQDDVTDYRKFIEKAYQESERTVVGLRKYFLNWVSTSHIRSE